MEDANGAAALEVTAVGLLSRLGANSDVAVAAGVETAVGGGAAGRLLADSATLLPTGMGSGRFLCFLSFLAGAGCVPLWPCVPGPLPASGT